MPIDIKSLGAGAEDFLRQMLPFLVKQKFQKQMLDYQAKVWLEKSQKEYEAYGKIQDRLQQQGQLNAIFGDISDVMKGGVKGAPFPGMEFIERGQRYGLPMGEATLPPEEERQSLEAQYEQAAMPLIMARITQQQPSQEDVTRALSVFGQEAVYSMIGDFAGDVVKRAEQDLRGREVSVSEELVPVRIEEAKISRAKVDIEKIGGKTAKELQTEITKLSNDRDTQIQKYAGIGSPTGRLWTDQQRVVAAKISKIDRRLKEIEQLTGQQILPSQQDYETFKMMATENVAAGKDIDWEQALIIGFDIYWIKKLQKELGAVIKRR